MVAWSAPASLVDAAARHSRSCTRIASKPHTPADRTRRRRQSQRRLAGLATSLRRRGRPARGPSPDAGRRPEPKVHKPRRRHRSDPRRAPRPRRGRARVAEGHDRRGPSSPGHSGDNDSLASSDPYDAVCSRVQHALAAAGDRRKGAGGPSLGLLADGVGCGMHRPHAANSCTCHWASRAAPRVATPARHAEFGDSVKINFAGPSKVAPAWSPAAQVSVPAAECTYARNPNGVYPRLGPRLLCLLVARTAAGERLLTASSVWMTGSGQRVRRIGCRASTLSRHPLY